MAEPGRGITSRGRLTAQLKLAGRGGGFSTRPLAKGCPRVTPDREVRDARTGRPT